LAAGATAAQTLSLSGPGGQSASLTAADVAALPHVQVQRQSARPDPRPFRRDARRHSGQGRRAAQGGDQGAGLATVVRFTAKDGYRCWTWRRPIRSRRSRSSSSRRRARPARAT